MSSSTLTVRDDLEACLAEFIGQGYRIPGVSVPFSQFRDLFFRWCADRGLQPIFTPRLIAHAVRAAGLCYGVIHSNRRFIGNWGPTPALPGVPFVEHHGKLVRQDRLAQKLKRARPCKARAIRGIAKSLLRNGNSLQQAVQLINARGYRRPDGSPHTSRSVREVLK